jgi:Cu(I)/Ag(I) efflux system membrane fusion protein/cobalt-zinc-cadmium efflux system membrane fusion protein
MSQRKNSFLIIALVGLVSTLAFGFALTGPSHSNLNAVAELVTPASAEAAEEAVEQYTCGMHPMIITDEPGLCPICNMELTPLKSAGAGASSKPDGERVIKYWVAPMDATFIRDEPGKSPMGMDLVPVYEDEAATGSIISIDPVTSQNMGVRMDLVKRKNLSRTVRTVGLVGY